MDAKTANNQIPELKTPAIRHLAWLCRAPQLLHSSLTFEPARYLPVDADKTLRLWDQNPETAPALLKEAPQKRLGFYFERLYRVLLQDLLGWDILLQNQQIQSNGRTIGELDFVVHNRLEDRIEHHEIAIKYYLGVVAAPVYCTKIASRLIRTYTDRHGLKELVRELLGQDISKQQQSSDWGGPDLNDAQRDYAASDVRYLHRMKEELDRRLAREGRTEMAQACFDFLPTRARLDLAGWPNADIFSHE